jgi:hypothetical protein
MAGGFAFPERHPLPCEPNYDLRITIHAPPVGALVNRKS